MTRLVSLSLVVLVIVSLASMSYAQCGGFGGYPQQFRGYAPAYGGGHPSQRFYPTHSQGCFGPVPNYSAPQLYYGGNNYSAPQGSGSRGYAPAYPSQPIFQPAPRYSQPQGSGARSFPSQGSGSR